MALIKELFFFFFFSLGKIGRSWGGGGGKDDGTPRSGEGQADVLIVTSLPFLCLSIYL